MEKEVDKYKISLSAVSAYDVDKELAAHLQTSYEKAQRSSDPVYRAKCFYEIQTCRELGNTEDQCKIGVYVNETVSTYHGHITKTMKDINIAAPGIKLYKTDKNNAKITIGEGKGKGCYTQGIFKGPHGAYVHLDTDWSTDWKEQTTIHELLHALGFQHEFKRKDAEKYVNIKTDDYQYKDKGDHQRIRGLTRFDPFSVMMYPERREEMERLENGDIVWRLKSGTTPNKQMSELDKVALNLVFRPCIENDYNPKIGPVTDMLYCGRSVMTGNQQVSPTDTDGRCGPDNWANCPACRVLIDGVKMKCQRMHDKGKWQGWSGLFYCGKKFTTPKTYGKNGTSLEHDGVCGPDNGPPCNDCGRELYPEYDYSKEVESDDDCVIL